MSKQIPELDIIATPTAGQESLIETVVARHDTYETSRMTLAQIFTLGSISGAIKSALDTLSGLISGNTSSINTLSSTLSSTKLNIAGGTRTGLTANRAIITDATGVETYLTGTTTQVIGFNGAGKPIAVDPSGLSTFGDGSDGDVIISTNTTLVRDMYYRNLTINSTIVLNPNGYKIFVSEILTNNGIIRRNGNNGGNGNIGGASGPPGGTGGAALNQGSLNADLGGSNGLDGYGAGSGGAFAEPSFTVINGANGGTPTNVFAAHNPLGGGIAIRGSLYNIAYTAQRTILWLFNPASSVSPPGQYKGPAASAGGGSDWNFTPGTGGSGGGAGGNGGVIWIAAFIFNNTSGLIESKGGNGGNGGAYSSISGGGGGGGQGGVFYLIYSTLTALGTVTLTGGTAGTGGTGAQNGNTGVTIQIQIT